MKTDPLRSLKRFPGKRLLLDTNLLFEYLAGIFYRTHPQASRHGGSFKEDEFELLALIIHHFEKAGQVWTTPHLLTEIWSLAKMVRQNRESFIRFIVPLIGGLDESFDSKKIGMPALTHHPRFVNFGFSDTAMIKMAHDPLLIFTNDQPLARYLIVERKRKNVIYFGDLKLRCL